MGDLFNQFSPVNPEYQSEKFEKLIAYEELYMKLLRNYKTEIAEIQNMMLQLRQEREEFYRTKLPIIEQSIRADDVLSDTAKKNWIIELRTNVEKSFEISETLISHYVTSNLEEFKSKMQAMINKV
ncbi:MAG: hypothetical protein NC093_03975 [Alistipes sp.]|nr:hypothetical protein [Alistipes sp.]